LAPNLGSTSCTYCKENNSSCPVCNGTLADCIKRGNEFA
jgi:hypothetical protein